MRIIRCDFHASQQTIAMLDCETGEVSEYTLKYEILIRTLQMGCGSRDRTIGTSSGTAAIAYMQP